MARPMPIPMTSTRATLAPSEEGAGVSTGATSTLAGIEGGRGVATGIGGHGDCTG